MKTWAKVRPIVSTAAVLAMALPALMSAAYAADVDEIAQAVEDKVLAWRRDIHQHPELGNREFRTSALVAEHLRELCVEVRTGIAEALTGMRDHLLHVGARRTGDAGGGAGGAGALAAFNTQVGASIRLASTSTSR